MKILLRSTVALVPVLCASILLTATLPLASVSAHEDEKKTWDPEEKWAKADAEFQKKDAENPPPEGGIVFYGSSSMRMWDVERFFPNRKVINRGFGGSTMPDAVHFAERWVVPLKPSCILIYEGDNDIKNGYSADEVIANYEALIAKFDEALPGTPVIFVPIKPSISRWTMWPKMLKANRAIEAISKKRDHLYYADIITPMLEFNGLPKAFLFKSDGLHLNDVGYEIWKEAIDPIIEQALKGKPQNDGKGETKSAAVVRETDDERRARSAEVREKMSRMTEAQKDKLRKMMEKRMKENPNMSREERGSAFREALEKAAADVEGDR